MGLPRAPLTCACAPAAANPFAEAQANYGEEGGAFARNLVASDAEPRECGRVFRVVAAAAAAAAAAPPAAHVPGEVARCAAAAAATAAALAQIYVWKGDEGDHRFFPFAAPLLDGEPPAGAGGGDDAPLPDSALHAALAGALYPALRFAPRALDDEVADLAAARADDEEEANEVDGVYEADAWRAAAAALRAAGLRRLTYFRPRDGDADNRGCVFPHFVVGVTPGGSLAGAAGLTVWT